MPRSGEMRVYLKENQLLIDQDHQTNKLEPRALHSCTARSETLALEGLEHAFVFTDSGVELYATSEWGDVEIGTRLETT